MLIRTLIAAVTMAAFSTTAASAATFDQTQQQVIISNGQAFNFSFSPLLPSSGVGGQLSITLNGDYSPRNYPPLSEGATLTLESIGGFADLYNNSGSAVVGANTIAGLTLDTSAISGSGNNVQLDYVFDLSAGLLDTLLGDGLFEVAIANTSDVGVGFGGFVAVGLSYEEGPAVSPVPLPAGLPLFVAGLGMFGLLGRRSNKPA